ncbi:hypothetical protein D5Q54_19225 [Vibrio cholerae]|nr:hypothetical protein [Vibrio cholerae]
MSSVLKRVETQEKHELIDFSERLPVVVAFLLLKNQTEPYTDNGLIKLRLKQAFNNKFWLQYQMSKGSWQCHELPLKIAL